MSAGADAEAEAEQEGKVQPQPHGGGEISQSKAAAEIDPGLEGSSAPLQEPARGAASDVQDAEAAPTQTEAAQAGVKDEDAQQHNEPPDDSACVAVPGEKRAREKEVEEVPKDDAIERSAENSAAKTASSSESGQEVVLMAEESAKRQKTGDLLPLSSLLSCLPSAGCASRLSQELRAPIPPVVATPPPPPPPTRHFLSVVSLQD